MLEQLATDVREALIRGFQLGGYYLLTGAGASAGATSANNVALPLGEALAKELANEFRIDLTGIPSPVPIHLVHDEIVRSQALTGDGRDLARYYRDRFVNCKPTWQGKIMSLPWRRIFTLNTDDVLERAAITKGVPIESFIGYDHFVDPPQASAPVQVVHLHGFAERLQSTNDLNFVFGQMEYYAASSTPGIWHRIFFDTFADRPYVILGDHVTMTTMQRRDAHFLIASGLMQRRFISRLLGDYDLARTVYASILDAFHWNARYWDQRALLEADANNLNLAHDYAWEALGRQDHPYSQTTLGVIMLKMSVRDTDLSIFWEALEHLRVGRTAPPNESEDPNVHPFTAFFTHTARLAELVHETIGSVERQRLLAEWKSWFELAREVPDFRTEFGESQLRAWRAEWLTFWASSPLGGG
ncbi:MAG: hypothetical protein WCL53_03755 [Chloroflexota bacterium]